MYRIIKSKKALVVAIVLLLTVIVIAGYYAFNWNDDRQILSWEIDGLNSTSLAEVNDITVTYEGLTFEKADLGSLKNEIESLPYVQYADIYRSGFESVSIDIEEEKGLAFVVESSGKVNILSKSGKLLPYRSLDTDEKLLVLRSEFGSLDSLVLAEGASIINELGSIEQIDLIVSELVYIGGGQFKAITSYKDIQVLFGTKENIRAKTERLISFWKNFITGSIPVKKNIDLRWGQKIIMY